MLPTTCCTQESPESSSRRWSPRRRSCIALWMHPSCVQTAGQMFSRQLDCFLKLSVYTICWLDCWGLCLGSWRNHSLIFSVFRDWQHNRREHRAPRVWRSDHRREEDSQSLTECLSPEYFECLLPGRRARCFGKLTQSAGRDQGPLVHGRERERQFNSIESSKYLSLSWYSWMASGVASSHLNRSCLTGEVISDGQR